MVLSPRFQRFNITCRSVFLSFTNMRIIVSLGWSIYPAGYFLGQINTSAGAAEALYVTYNIPDFVNQIAFVLACWSCAKSDTIANDAKHERLRQTVFQQHAHHGHVLNLTQKPSTYEWVSLLVCAVGTSFYTRSLQTSLQERQQDCLCPGILVMR